MEQIVPLYSLLWDDMVHLSNSHGSWEGILIHKDSENMVVQFSGSIVMKDFNNASKVQVWLKFL